MRQSLKRELATAAHQELLGNILPFWRQLAPDPLHGGFIAELSNDLKPNPSAAKGLILNARILWIFSAAWRLTQSCHDATLAKRAFEYLNKYFFDAQFGGYFWELDQLGNPVNRTKKIYGQAFVIYALVEYFRSFGDSAALSSAQLAFRCIESSSHDNQNGGYVESRSADWQPCEDVRLSEKDLNEKKSMNNHLHLLEAYTNLLRVWPDDLVKERLQELIGIFETRILDKSNVHFNHFFDEVWNPRSSSYTYGHDIEGSWLLCEAASSLGDAKLLESIQFLATRIARCVLEEGMDSAGGIFYEGANGAVIRHVKEWWPQAEAVVGFLNAWQISQEDQFLEAAAACWRFIQEKIVDRSCGEWYWAVSRDGQPDTSLPKLSTWKCPYHNGRACLEIIQRTSSFGL